ncbi:MAG: hypothetical protein MHM6MM_003182 [Cercozoa sp. M6MM]
MAPREKPKPKSAAQAIMVGGIAVPCSPSFSTCVLRSLVCIMQGGIEICMTYPTEYVKTQMQLYKDMSNRGAIGCVKHTMKHHGITGLYRGLQPLLFFAVPKSAARFSAYEFLKKEALSNGMTNEKGQISNSGALLAGLGAGVAEALTVVTPQETMKVKLIDDQMRPAGQRKYRSFFHGVRTILAEQGLRGTYQGLGPTLLKQGSNQAIRWACYERFKHLLAGQEDPRDMAAYKHTLAGAMAGAASVFGNTPLDVIKTRMQGLEAHKYRNSLHCAATIWKEHGPLGFYHGVGPRLARVCADVAIVMTLYEQINSLWERYINKTY